MWGDIWKPTVEKSQTNATSVIMHLLMQDTFKNPQWLCILWSKHFEETFKKTQWGKVKQMQPVWSCILWFKQFENTFENAQWRKIKQMQPRCQQLVVGKKYGISKKHIFCQTVWQNNNWGKCPIECVERESEQVRCWIYANGGGGTVAAKIGRM